MKRFIFLAILASGFSAISLAGQVYSNGDCLLLVDDRIPICPCLNCQPVNVDPPLTVAWFDEGAGSGDVTPACVHTFTWNDGDVKNGYFIFWQRCLVNKYMFPILDEKGKIQCCLGGYGGQGKLPNPNESKGNNGPEARESSMSPEDAARFAE